MSDMRTGRGHMTGMAKSPSPGEDSKQAPDAEAGASRSGRRPSKDVSVAPPDGKSISHRLVEAVPAVARPDPAGSAAVVPATVGGEYLKVGSSAGMEMRRAAHLPDGRLAQVMEEHLSLETTNWEATVTELARGTQDPDVPQRSVRDAHYGTARGLESRGRSTPEVLCSRFAFVMKGLLDNGAPMEAILSAVAGWHDGLVSQRPDIDLKATVALRKALQQGLDLAITDNWTAAERLPAVRQAVGKLLMAPNQAVIDDLVGLLQGRKGTRDLEARLIDCFRTHFKSAADAAAPAKWVASLLKSIGAASAEMDQAAQARGQDGTMLVLQAVFKAMPAVMEKNAHLTPLASALAVGLPAQSVVLAWTRAHAATLPQAEQVDLAMSVLVQHEKFNLSGQALKSAFEALALGLAHSALDSKAAVSVDHAGAASALAKWVINLNEMEISFSALSGLASGFGFTSGNGGGQTVAALLKLALAGKPPDVKRAVDILQSWSLGLCPYKTIREHPAKAADLQLQIRAYFQAAIDEVLPLFSPEVAPTRKALLHALYAKPAKG